MTQEQKQIIRNARAAYKAHLITKKQLWDVYRMVATDKAEKELMKGPKK